jgi:hypothetical protein
MSQYKIEGRTEGGRVLFSASGIESGETADKLLEVAIAAKPEAVDWEVTGVDVAPGCRVTAGIVDETALVHPRLTSPCGWFLCRVLGSNADTPWSVDGLSARCSFTGEPMGLPLGGLCAVQIKLSAGKSPGVVWFSATGAKRMQGRERSYEEEANPDEVFYWLAWEIERAHHP